MISINIFFCFLHEVNLINFNKNNLFQIFESYLEIPAKKKRDTEAQFFLCKYCGASMYNVLMYRNR